MSTATLAMVIVGTEEFWMFYILRTVAEPEMINDAEFVWTILSIAATGSVIGAILGAVLADKFGRKKTLLATSIPSIIRIVCIYTIDMSSLWSCVPLFIGEIGLGMTWIVVPLYISEICNAKIRGALMMLQVPFFYVGKSIGIGIELLELCLVSVVLIGIFVAAFTWLPETPYYLASKKKYETAAKSLAFYRNIDDVTARNDVQMIIEEVEAKTHNNGRRCCQKIHEFVRGSNGKGLIIVILLIIVKWSEHKLEARNYLVDVIQGPLVPNVYNARLIAYLVSLITGILIVSAIDVIGRRSFLLFATFISFVTMVVLLICVRNNKPQWMYNGVCVIFHFFRL